MLLATAGGVAISTGLTSAPAGADVVAFGSNALCKWSYFSPVVNSSGERATASLLMSLRIISRDRISP